MPKLAANVNDLPDAGRARVEVDDRVLVLGLEQVGPRLRHVLDQLGVDDEGDGQRVDGEPLAVRIAEHRRQLVEVHRLERRDDVLGDRVDARGREVVRGVRLRPVARLVERDDGRRRADVVVDDLDFGIALLERGELRRPVGPGRAGVEAHDHAFLLGGFVERLLAGIELAANRARSARAHDAGQRRAPSDRDGAERDCDRRCVLMASSFFRCRAGTGWRRAGRARWRQHRAHRRFDFESAVARRRPRPAASRRRSGRATYLRREHVLARRPRAASSMRSGRTSTRTALPARAAVRRRGEAADRRVDRLRVEHRAVEQVGAADEARDERVRRPVVDLLRRPDLHEAAVAQHDDAVGERQRLVLVVRDQQRRDVLLALDAPDLVAHRDARGRVERGQRLVEQQRARARTPARAPARRAAAGRRKAAPAADRQIR